MIDPHTTRANADEAVNRDESSVFVRTFETASDLPERATRSVLAFALEHGFGPAARARLGGALADVLDNVVRRAYPAGRGSVSIEAEVRGNELVVTVRDSGVGFDVRDIDAHLLARPLHSGLARVASQSDGLAIDSTPGAGTRVVLRFVRASAAFDGDSTTDLSDHDFLSPTETRALLSALRRLESTHAHTLSPALAVVVGRLLAGPEPRALAERALWS